VHRRRWLPARGRCRAGPCPRCGRRRQWRRPPPWPARRPWPPAARRSSGQLAALHVALRAVENDAVKRALVRREVDRPALRDLADELARLVRLLVDVRGVGLGDRAVPGATADRHASQHPCTLLREQPGHVRVAVRALQLQHEPDRAGGGRDGSARRSSDHRREGPLRLGRLFHAVTLPCPCCRV